MELVLLQEGRAWTLDELGALGGAPASSVHRELGRLVDAGLVERDARQRPHQFIAATSAPAYAPLRELLELTTGVPARLADALAGVGGVRAAAIHGGWAAGRLRPDSDVDVLVVTDGDRRAAQRAVRSVARRAGRDADPTVLSIDDFEKLTATRNPFLAKILNGPRIDLIGDIAELGGPA